MQATLGPLLLLLEQEGYTVPPLGITGCQQQQLLGTMLAAAAAMEVRPQHTPLQDTWALGSIYMQEGTAQGTTPCTGTCQMVGFPMQQQDAAC